MIASVLAIIAGVGATFVAGSILKSAGSIGFSGAVRGGGVAVVVFAASWTLPGRDLRMGTSWRTVGAVTLGLLAVAAAWWITMWDFVPWTLEGAWMYAILLLAGAGSDRLSLTLRSDG